MNIIIDTNDTTYAANQQFHIELSSRLGHRFAHSLIQYLNVFIPHITTLADMTTLRHELVASKNHEVFLAHVKEYIQCNYAGWSDADFEHLQDFITGSKKRKYRTLPDVEPNKTRVTTTNTTTALYEIPKTTFREVLREFKRNSSHTK
jgi:hypothetical protein